jgi:hypothetical protein
MNFPAFTVRHWISLGLCVLGLLVPVGVMFYGQVRYSMMMNTPNFNRWSWVESVSFQWLPFTAILWLLGAYVCPVVRVHWVGWGLFLLGLLLSSVNYFLLTLYKQQPIFYITRNWISLGLHLLGFAVPFIVTLYLRLKYSGKSDIGSIGYQWIPVTSILWLIGAYVWPESRVHLLGWILFGFGITLSAVWYGLTRIYR